MGVRKGKSKMGRRGFSVIELVMVMVLIAVLAAVVAPMVFRGASAVTIGAMARKVKDDIRYAQALALARSGLDAPSNVATPKFAYRIRFNVPDANCTGANQYTIVNDADNDGVWGEAPPASAVVESARIPSTGASYFCVRLDSGDYSGYAVNGGAADTIEFDNYGVPYDGAGVRLAADKSIAVAKGAETMTVVVTAGTGRVYVQ